MVARRWIFTVKVIKQIPQILLRHRNRSNELLSLLFFPSFFQLFFVQVFAHLRIHIFFMRQQRLEFAQARLDLTRFADMALHGVECFQSIARHTKHR